jgi:hypothetical protein
VAMISIAETQGFRPDQAGGLNSVG